jgi:hypothetical protein
VRNTAGGIATFAAIFFVIPPLLNVLPSSWNNAVSPYLPDSAGRSIFMLTHGSHRLAPAHVCKFIAASSSATEAVLDSHRAVTNGTESCPRCERLPRPPNNGRHLLPNKVEPPLTRPARRPSLIAVNYSSAGGVIMSADRTVEVLRKVLEAFNKHDLDTIISYFAEHCVFESPRGPDRWGHRFVGKGAPRALGAPPADSGRPL